MNRSWWVSKGSFGSFSARQHLKSHLRMTESMKHGMAVLACLTVTGRMPGLSGFPRMEPDLGRG